MAYKLVIDDDRRWRKDCAAIPHERLVQILRSIRALEQEPWKENVQVKQLPHYPLAQFRLRVGDYRVLFDKNNATKTIHLLRVLHRSKLY